MSELDGKMVHGPDRRRYMIHDPKWWQFFRRYWYWRKGKRTGNVGTIPVEMEDGSMREYNAYEVFW